MLDVSVSIHKLPGERLRLWALEVKSPTFSRLRRLLLLHHRMAVTEPIEHFAIELGASRPDNVGMPVAPIRFQPEHALEVVLYVTNRLRYPTFHSVSKMLYFADREHLSRYGSLLTGDNYVAMRLGPVPSAIYNLMKAAAGRREPQIPPAFYDLVEKAIGVTGPYRLKPLRGANLKRLSASQRACLDEAIRAYGRLSLASLTRKSHDAAWKSALSNEFIDVRAIAKTLKNGKEVLTYLND